MSNVSIAGYAGWPTYDTFLIVSLTDRPVYDPNPLRSNPNPKKPVSGSCRVHGLGRTLTPLSEWPFFHPRTGLMDSILHSNPALTQIKLKKKNYSSIVIICASIILEFSFKIYINLWSLLYNYFKIYYLYTNLIS